MRHSWRFDEQGIHVGTLFVFLTLTLFSYTVFAPYGHVPSQFFPRKETHVNHVEIRNAIAQGIRLLLEGSCEIPITLRPYQRHTLEKTEKWLSDSHGSRRGYFVYPTGLGKTALYTSIIHASVGIRSLIIVPTKTLDDQTVNVITRFTKGIIGQISSMEKIKDDDGRIIAVRSMDETDIIVTTDESFFLHAYRLSQLFKPGLIIYDECHWGYTPKAQGALSLFPEAIILACTATPDFLTTFQRRGFVRMHVNGSVPLYGNPSRFCSSHFGTCLDEYTVQWGIAEGYLAPLKWARFDLDEVDLTDVPIVNSPQIGYDYEPSALNKELREKWPTICERIAAMYAANMYDLQNRTIFTVCTRIDLAEELARVMSTVGASSACVSSRTPNKERRDILKAQRNGDIKFLTSVSALREGWDSPISDTCIMLWLMQSRLAYMQTVGRVLRMTDRLEEKVAWVIDPYVQHATFAPLSAPVVFGSPGSHVRVGGTLLGAEEHLNEPDTGSEVVTIGDAPFNGEQEDERGLISYRGSDYCTALTFGKNHRLGLTHILNSIDGKNVQTLTGMTLDGSVEQFYRVNDLLWFLLQRISA